MARRLWFDRGCPLFESRSALCLVAYLAHRTSSKPLLIKTGQFAGTGELYINGEKVDEVEMPNMHISTYSLAETFDVGRDTGTQVDPAYAGSPFPFTGALDRVVITLTETADQRTPPTTEFID